MAESNCGILLKSYPKISEFENLIFYRKLCFQQFHPLHSNHVKLCHNLCAKTSAKPKPFKSDPRFREHLRNVERNDRDASKPVAKHSNLPKYSIEHVAVSGLSLHLGSSERHKTLEQKLSSKSALLIPTLSTSAFHSTNLFLFSRHHIPINSRVLPSFQHNR